jgi:EAL domain-containing protein (putative c-di-GMP-specific phosphodiesterase class I)
VRLAVTGYGGGTTSLALLRDLPLSTVKLARQVLSGVPQHEARTLLARTIIRLCVELELRVVAEGVDSQAQLQLLRELGCDAVQSLLCCLPLPAAACADWLRQAALRV